MKNSALFKKYFDPRLRSLFIEVFATSVLGIHILISYGKNHLLIGLCVGFIDENIVYNL